MKKFWKKFLKFLRDPALQTILTFLTLIGVGIWGIIQGWLARLFAWLMEKFLWPNWLALLLGIAILLLGGYWVKTKFRTTTNKIKPTIQGMTYHEVWGVLWGWPPLSGRYFGDGPLCPIHRLPVQSEIVRIKKDEYYEFRCPGDQGDEGHKILGPKLTQLVKGGWANEPDLYEDVRARLKAKMMK